MARGVNSSYYIVYTCINFLMFYFYFEGVFALKLNEAPIANFQSTSYKTCIFCVLAVLFISYRLE